MNFFFKKKKDTDGGFTWVKAYKKKMVQLKVLQEVTVNKGQTAYWRVIPIVLCFTCGRCIKQAQYSKRGDVYFRLGAYSMSNFNQHYILLGAFYIMYMLLRL